MTHKNLVVLISLIVPNLTDREKLGKSIKSDFSSLVKDFKLKFGISI